MTKKTTYLNSKSKILELLIKRGIACEISFTSNTTYLETEDKKFFLSDKQIPMKYLSFIKQVKEYAKGLPELHKEHKKGVKKIRTQINYMRFSKIDNGVYTDLVEIDLNKAYWEIAYEKKYISEAIYQKGLEVPKFVRLVALGSLASIKKIYYFDGKEKKHIEDKCDYKTRAFFFDVSKEVDFIMNDVFNKVPVLWYWVDAFFLKSEHRAQVEEILKKSGRSYSVDPISRIEVFAINEGLQKAEVWQQDKKNPKKEEMKPFFIFDRSKNEERLIKATRKFVKRLSENTKIDLL